MKIAFYFFLVVPFYGVLSYVPSGQESLFSGLFFHDLMNRLRNGKEESNEDVSYLDLADGNQLDAKTTDLERDQIFPLDYDNNAGDVNVINPSIRDQESLKHSSLWGNKAEGKNNINQQEIKSEISLPAYCNPPNPCPLGYTEEQGCLEEFENTAMFSRRYQAIQDCMCDSEHMFDCPNSIVPLVDNMLEIANLDFGHLLHQPLKTNQGIPYKNSVAKKYHSYYNGDPMVQVTKNNPFLTGEKLPVAAKKGNNMF